MELHMYSVPAVFEWTDFSFKPPMPFYIAGSETVSVQLYLQFNEEKQTVRMWFRVDLKGETLNETYFPVSGYIHRSAIVCLIQDPAHHLPADISAELHGPTTCLRLVLDKPIHLFYDPDVALEQGSFEKLVDSVELLSEQTVIAIHVDQRNISCAAALQRLCEMLTNESIKLRSEYGCFADFFCGPNAYKGAQDDGRNDVESASVPPPHADDQEAPPPQLCAQALKKRKWTHADTGTATFNNAELLTQHKLQMEALLASQQTQTQKIQCLLEDLGGIKDLICGRSEFKEVVKQECQEDLKDNLENGLD